MKIMSNPKRDLVVHAFVRVLGGFISFASVFLLTYLFSASQIGEYNLLLSTINISVSLGTLWLSQSILRFYHDDKNVGLVISLSFFSLLVSVIFYVILALMFQQEINFWILSYIIVYGAYQLGLSFFRGSDKIYHYMIMELAIAIGRIFPMVILSSFFNNINIIFTSQIFWVGILFIFLIIKNWEIFRNLNYKISRTGFLQYFKYGLPLVGLTVSNWFLSASDRYIISFLGNDSEVGIYSTNYFLANSIYMMFSLIVLGAFHPLIMREWKISQRSTEKLVNQSIDIYFTLMIPLTFFGVLKSPILLGLSKGGYYSQYSEIFNWTAIGIFIYGLSMLFHKYFELTDNTITIFNFNLVSAIVNIGLNFLLIPIWGFQIAACTTFLAYIVYIVLVYFKMRGSFKVKLNYRHLIIHTIANCFFYVVDSRFVQDTTVITFLVEGLIYVCFILFVYHVTNLFKITDGLKNRI